MDTDAQHCLHGEHELRDVVGVECGCLCGEAGGQVGESDVGHIVVDRHLPGGDGLNVAARLSRQVNNLTYLLMMIILYFLQVVRIRIQHFRLNTDPDPIRIQGFDKQKVEKFYS
jgi:hypothetical protein